MIPVSFSLHTEAIKRKVELDWGTEDSEYLQKVELHTEGALNEVRPDIIVYNAGTDILDGDPLGGLSISPQVLIRNILPASNYCSYGYNGDGIEHLQQIHTWPGGRIIDLGERNTPECSYAPLMFFLMLKNKKHHIR